MMLFIILEKLRFLSKLAFIIKYRSITTIDFTRYDTAWILYNLILPPLLINLVSDIVNFKNQMIYGFISIMFVFSVICLNILTRFKLLLPSFIKQIDPTNPYIYTYFDFKFL